MLGDTFLRSAYVVYDLANNAISLAPTNFNATASTVLEIAAGANGVPDASGVPGAVASASVTSGGARNGGQPTVTATATATRTGGAAAARTGAAGLGALAAAAGAGLLVAL